MDVSPGNVAVAEPEVVRSAGGTCVISSSNLVKDFGRVRALNGLSLCIYQGETYGLLGPNGSGKTTFIRMVAGLLKPTQGRLDVLGSRVPEHVREVLPWLGYMPQLQALYTDLTVWQNVEFFACIFG